MPQKHVMILAGEASLRFDHLTAGAASAPLTWLFRAKEHSMLRVALTTTWGGRVVEEVRL